jgi:hypothetical protein
MKSDVILRLFQTAIGLILISLLLYAGTAEAREIAGVNLPEKVLAGVANQKLVLNGAGVRRKFFIKVYVCALYLPEKSLNIETILNMPGPKQIAMYFVHSKVGVKKIVAGWNKGFIENLSKEELLSVEGRLARFNGLFQTVHRGDVIRLEYAPEKGTKVWLNDIKLGHVRGADFFRALLKVWLGPHPADEELKKALVGTTD